MVMKRAIRDYHTSRHDKPGSKPKQKRKPRGWGPKLKFWTVNLVAFIPNTIARWLGW